MFKSNIATIMFFALISLNMSLKLQFRPGHNAQLFVTVDNQLLEVLVNGSNIDISNNGANNNSWTDLKTIPFTFFGKSGDSISIRGKNENNKVPTSAQQNDPAAILATIKYTDEHGNAKTLSTSGAWVCNGKDAFVQGNNSSPSIWYGVRNNKYFDNIEGSANWIWATGYPVEATCVYTFPKNASHVSSRTTRSSQSSKSTAHHSQGTKLYSIPSKRPTGLNSKQASKHSSKKSSNASENGSTKKSTKVSTHESHHSPLSHHSTSHDSKRTTHTTPIVRKCPKKN